MAAAAIHPLGVTTSHTAGVEAAEASRRGDYHRRRRNSMDLSHTSRSAHEDTSDAAAEKKRNVRVSSFAGGLSAWLGGIAFCVGFGVIAPAWGAIVLTVLSVSAAIVSHTVLRRNARIADPPAE
jgi:hypothetical protein